MRKPRSEMIAETRAKLLAAGRKAFGSIGYADASMDDFTAEAGLTRGALYHHFGDKKGLLLAVVGEIDAEMTKRLCDISSRAETRWEGFIEENVGYVRMALEPEIQRIMFRDGPAVLGDPSRWPNANGCILAVAPKPRCVEAGGDYRRHRSGGMRPFHQCGEQQCRPVDRELRRPRNDVQTSRAKLPGLSGRIADQERLSSRGII